MRSMSCVDRGQSTAAARHAAPPLRRSCALRAPVRRRARRAWAVAARVAARADWSHRTQSTRVQVPSERKVRPADAMFYSVLFLSSDPGARSRHPPRRDGGCAGRSRCRWGRGPTKCDGRSRHKSQVTKRRRVRGQTTPEERTSVTTSTQSDRNKKKIEKYGFTLTVL